jgi:hypothetical protein
MNSAKPKTTTDYALRTLSGKRVWSDGRGTVYATQKTPKAYMTCRSDDDGGSPASRQRRADKATACIGEPCEWVVTGTVEYFDV